jgi:hypothetical protein
MTMKISRLLRAAWDMMAHAGSGHCIHGFAYLDERTRRRGMTFADRDRTQVPRSGRTR